MWGSISQTIQFKTLRMSALKRKIIEEYNKYVEALFVGKSFNYDYIIDMITFSEMGSLTSNPELIQNYYLNK